MDNLQKYTIKSDQNIRSAVKAMDLAGIGFIVVVNMQEEVVGVVTDGDFRRAVLNGKDLSESVLDIANPSFKYLNEGFEESELVELLGDRRINKVPVLKSKTLFDIIDRSYLTSYRAELEKKKISSPVVIMAGGKGTRMAPFTSILPKPLIPINGKSMLEIIMDNYVENGMSNFYLSLNFKANLIKAYFEYTDKNYDLNYILEDKPLGTGGALKYLENKLDEPFFVSNCDIIIKEDYSKIYDYHIDGEFDITMVCSMQHHKIPYGVCEVSSEGELIALKEKPEYDFLVNAGMYLINPSTLSYIPEDEFFNVTDLMEVLMKSGKKVGVYPVSEKAYVDVGQWAEYKKAVNLMSLED